MKLAPRISGVLAALVLALAPVPAFAISAPDSDMVLSNIRGYTGAVQDDDLLIVATYDIPYASLPTESATDAYVGRFLLTVDVLGVPVTADVNSTEIFHFNNKGYGLGVLSFYWTADQRSDDSIEHGNPNGETYTVRLNGKPGVFPGAVPSQESTAITWRTREDLTQDIIDLALELDRDAGWIANSFDLITTGDPSLFTAQGEEYFGSVIPRLSTMESSIFTRAVRPLVGLTRVPNETYSEQLNDYWDGTPLDDNMNSIAANQGVEPIVIRSIIALFFMLAISAMTAYAVRDQPKAPEFGLMTMCVTAPLFGAVNFLALQVVVVMGLFGVVGVLWAIWGHRA